MMQKEQFLQILKKYREGKASEEEKAFLLAYYNLFEAEPDVLETLSFAEKDRLKTGIRRRIRRRARMHEKAGRLNRKLPSWARIAASVAVLLLIAAGIYFRTIKQESDQLPLSAEINDIRPGGNMAVLTLADGAQVVLDTVQNGVLTYQGGVPVSKTGDGQVVYGLSGEQENDVRAGFNTIETPAGGQYQLVLPDGSKAWMNAKSSLRFPVSFRDDLRQVEMTGEVYFEISRNEKKPFSVLVKAAGRDEIAIDVLGTHFNVMAYEEEAAVKTTLVEGSVMVGTKEQAARNTPRLPGRRGGAKHETKNLPAGRQGRQGKKLLKPGQQAAMDRNTGVMRVAEANIEEAVAWKNGYFLFANEELRSIMRKIARWYDVDVEYRGEIPRKVFGGTVSKFENVSEVLNMLELTGSVHFEIKAPAGPGQKRRIVVMP